MTLAEKAHAIARMFEQGRDNDAYFAMDWMLKYRRDQWPAWLTETARQIDGDRPVNVEGNDG